MKKLIIVFVAVIMLSFTISKKQSTRSELVKYGEYDQKTLFMQMGKIERDGIWIDRLTKEAKLYKGEKRIILLNIAKSLPDENYDPKKDEIRVIELFGKDEARRILTTLRLPYESPLTSKFLNQESSLITSAVDCGHCSTQSDWCSHVNEACIYAGCTSYSNYGCGTLWLYSCDGECTYYNPHEN